MANLEKVQTNGGAIKDYSLDPFAGMSAVRRMMDSFFDTMPFPPAFFGALDVQPRANIYEKDGAYTIECAVPGYKRDDINVEVKGNEVTVSGKYAAEKTDDQKTYRRREMRQGSFSRTIAFPGELNHETVAAALEDGVLKVMVQPIKQATSKKVPITTK